MLLVQSINSFKRIRFVIINLLNGNMRVLRNARGTDLTAYVLSVAKSAFKEKRLFVFEDYLLIKQIESPN